jgi:hypothetical protein
VVEENNPEQKEDTDAAYEAMSMAVPEREDVVLPEDDEEPHPRHKSLRESMEDNPNLTDMQSALRVLLPKTGRAWLDNIQVSRVFPDSYNPMFNIFVKGLIQESDKDDEVTVPQAIAMVHTAMSNGIDGEGRIEIVALAGVTQQQEMQKEANGLRGL